MLAEGASLAVETREPARERQQASARAVSVEKSTFANTYDVLGHRCRCLLEEEFVLRTLLWTEGAPTTVHSTLRRTRQKVQS